MQVVIRNVPEQVTNNVLRNSLQPYMDKLSIQKYDCQKHAQKRFAFLTFLNSQDGDRFLIEYGQNKPTKTESIPPAKIQILSTPIYCEISRKPPDPQVLSNLGKDIKAKRQKARSKTVQDDQNVSTLPLVREPRPLPYSYWRILISVALDYLENSLKRILIMDRSRPTLENSILHLYPVASGAMLAQNWFSSLIVLYKMTELRNFFRGI